MTALLLVFELLAWVLVGALSVLAAVVAGVNASLVWQIVRDELSARKGRHVPER